MSHQRHLREDACAVDEHIDSAQIIVRTLDQRAYGVLRSHIDRSHCCANIVAAALVGAALQTLIDSLGEEQRAHPRMRTRRRSTDQCRSPRPV